MGIGWIEWIAPVDFVGRESGGGDPAFIVTHDGEPVTHNGAIVTHGTQIDPELLVMHEGTVVTSGGEIVTHGA